MASRVESRVIAGRYHLIARIGGGGMGEVFRARDSVLGRTVAIKLLQGAPSSTEPIERFRREAQAAARISHPNVVSVHDWGETEDTNYMVMEYVRGRNLREILRERGKLEPAQAAQVMEGVLGALSAAHEQGLVHRDIKPENVLVSVDGRVKVTDFGIARMAEGSSAASSSVSSSGGSGLFGTIAYVAPEQARGEAVDGRSDLYSAGCLLYELLTGSPPFEGETARVLYGHLHERVPAPSTSEPAAVLLDPVVACATAPDPAERYRSADQMRSALSSAAAGMTAGADLAELTEFITSEVSTDNQQTIAGDPVLAGKRKRRKRWLWSLVAVLLLAGVAGAIWMLRPLEVAPVLGQSEARARATLEAQGFQVKVEREYYLDEREGFVFRTEPSPGDQVRRGGVVVMVVSLGPELTEVPNLRGILIEAARGLIEEAGLRVGTVREDHRGEPAGTVVEQSVEPGTARKGEPVNLVVSKGPEIVKVPDVVNKPVAEARQMLKNTGFESVTKEVFHDAAAGTVVAQDPPARSDAAKGSTVTLTVSKGPAPFAMPDVRGKACSAAKSQLESLGMVVVVRLGDSCGSRTVAEQDPLPGATVRKGQEATLYLS